jgi:DNA-binding transcriptional MerR regulator
MSFTLTQAAKTLGVAQHKLIHLCEQKVVVPDVRDARGRGSSREFSERNLFDFVLALEMRKLELPVSFIRAILRVLRSFEEEARALLGVSPLTEGLIAANAPRITLLILDGERLYFRLAPARGQAHLFGGINIKHPRLRGRARQHQSVGRLEPAEANQLASEARTRTEIDLSQIARDLKKKLQQA